MKYDSCQPHTTFPQTRGYRSGPARPVPASRQNLQRHERSALWFELYRRGGRVILHHGHIRPVLIRDWSPDMDGIGTTIWASQTMLLPGGMKSGTPASGRRPRPASRHAQKYLHRKLCTIILAA